MKKIKQFKYVYIVLLSVILSVFLTIPVLAAETEEIPRITFTNTKSESTDLYISKTVESADSRFPAPEDDRFSFVLKLDGSAAKDEVYRVFNENGAEIFLYADGESTESKSNKLTYVTDRQGVFTLAAGQTAKFESVGAGVSYEITELSKDNYTQTSPAGGVPAVGTLTKEGKRVSFTNLYIEENEIPEEKQTNLVVSKAVIYPEGYQFSGNMEFGFSIKISGKPLSNVSFNIRNDATGESTGTGKTDSTGHFVLKGGCSAIFNEIPVNVDYEVSEDTPANGWRAIGKTSYAGATKAPLTNVSFTNAIASFAVTKTVEGNTETTDSFRFLLLKEDGAAFSYASYYLYNTDGSLAKEELLKTDARGYFVLNAGQTAIFQGILPGTVYTVQEQALAGYVQTVPVNPDGYKDKIVQDAVEVLPFVNTIHKERALLAVTKTVENITAGVGDAQQEFTFVLKSRKTIAGLFSLNEFKPLAGAVYHVNTKTGRATYKTDAEGKFVLRSNETAFFENMPLYNEYQVSEINIPEGYHISSKEMLVQDGKLKENLSFIFNNSYVPKTQELTVTKKVTGVGGDKNKIFTFHLKLMDDEKNPLNVGTYTYELLVNGKVVSKSPIGFNPDENGVFEFKLKHNEGIKFELPDGISYLVEELNIAKLNESGYEVTIDETAEGKLLEKTNVVITNYNDKAPEKPKNPVDNNDENNDEKEHQDETTTEQNVQQTEQQILQHTMSPKTGDNANISSWLIVLAVALAGIIFISLWKKKKN